MKALLKSFGYAFCGVVQTLRTERNMRIHTVVMLYMFGFLLCHDFFTVTRTQMALLLLACAAVTAGELVNTAVENVVDLVEKNKNLYCKIAKDAAAGAVLVSAVFAVGVGIAVLWQPQAFRAMLAYYRAHPVMLAVLALSLVAAFWFIFGFGKHDRKDSTHD